MCDFNPFIATFPVLGIFQSRPDVPGVWMVIDARKGLITLASGVDTTELAFTNNARFGISLRDCHINPIPTDFM